LLGFSLTKFHFQVQPHLKVYSELQPSPLSVIWFMLKSAHKLLKTGPRFFWNWA